MNNLSSIRSLLKKLSEEEIKNLNRLILSKGTKSNFENKSKLLIDLLLVVPSLSSLEIQMNLYQEKNYLAFNKLCSRLRDKIFESIVLDSSIEKGGYSKRNQIIFELKKKLIQADILNLKGLREHADAICKKVIVLSNEYEIYDLVIQSLIVREKFVRLRKNQKEISNLNIEIELNDRKYDSFRYCQSVFNVIMGKIAKSGTKQSYLIDLNKAIALLEIEFNKYHSSSTGYFLQLLKTQLFQVNNDFFKAELALEEAYKMIKEKSVYSDNRIGSILLSKSENCIQLGKFEESILLSDDAIKYFPNNIFNKALVHENKFYANYFSGNFENSKKEIDYLLNLPKENNIVVSIDKWKTLNASLMFLEMRYSECLALLSQLNEIERDKEGWNVNIRILIILCKIESSDFEGVDFSLLNLGKFMKRISKKNSISERYSIIFKILLGLANSGFDFKKIFSSKKKYFEQLSNKNSDTSWELKGPELIPFHIWFQSKVSGPGDLYSKIISNF